jgi:hypothetical protein
MVSPSYFVTAGCYSWPCSTKIHGGIPVISYAIVKAIVQDMDYGHMNAKSQILCGPNSNPNSK